MHEAGTDRCKPWYASHQLLGAPHHALVVIKGFHFQMPSSVDAISRHIGYIMYLSSVISSVASLLVVVLIPIVSAQGPGSIPTPTTSLQVFALPVGQGDCSVIQCPNGNIVVFDCGSNGGNGMSPGGIQNWLGSSINRVVAILISHPNTDHFNYLPDIMWNSTSVGAVIIGGTVRGYRSRGPDIRDWIDEWSNQGKLYTIGTAQSSPSSCIGNCVVSTSTNFCGNSAFQFNILAANNGTDRASNEQSIVMKMVVGGWSMLLSGDMEGKASMNIAKQLGVQLQSIVYKMSHHGASSKANMNDWLTPIQPQFAFASSGYNYGRCKHPTCVTINRLLNLNTITMTTPHQFYCGNPGGNPTINDTFQYNMLQTSPNNTHICLLTYVSANNIQPQSNCFSYLPTSEYQLTNEEEFDEECDPGLSSSGSTLSMVASFFVFTTTTLFSFLV